MQDLLASGAHFGHVRRNFNPKMGRFVFGVREGTHLIDLEKTVRQLSGALTYLKGLKTEGKTVLFVCTKPNLKQIVREVAEETKMPYMTHRWLGGVLTNFKTVKKQIEKLQQLEGMIDTPAWEKMTKKEKSMVSRQIVKLSASFEGIKTITKIPDAVFVVDTVRDATAVEEARSLNLPVIAIVDTNSDPTGIAYAIPANDDAPQAVKLILGEIVKALK